MPIPESLAPLWEALYNEVVAVHARWIIYRQLFAKSKERLNVLNEVAGTFFYVIQGTLIDNVQLTLSKLADPAATKFRENATLERLKDEIVAFSDPSLAEKLTALLAAYKASCERVRIRRNRQIAHYDHSTLLRQYGTGGAVELAPSQQEIEEALEALRNFMGTAEAYLTSSTTAYQHFISRYDGEALVYALSLGLRYQDLQAEGVVALDDFANSNRSAL
jgi:hypothetical protein